MKEQLEDIKKAIITGQHKKIVALVKQAVADKLDLDELINDSMIAAMDVVGEKFSRNEIFVPEMLVAAHTMKKGLDIVRPLLQEEDQGQKEAIMMCTVKGDLHDIGKNLVCMMLEGAGFQVVNLGVDIGVEDLMLKVEEVQPTILGLSALLTTTMPEMQRVMETLEVRGLREQVKVMVGGAPVSEAFAQKIGADGYGKDAAEAVTIAKRLSGSG